MAANYMYRMDYNLKPYPAYKNSGVPWLGKVPEHWEVRKLRQVLRQKSGRGRPDLPLLSVVREKGVILRDIDDQDTNRNYIPDDLSNYKVVREGQFAMNKMKAWQGSYGVSAFNGIVSPAYFVFDLTGVSGAYFHTAVRSKTYVPFFAQASNGVRIGQWDLSQSRMREVPFSIPPLPEQTDIVRFLDWADRRIQRVIHAREKRIKLLEEYKQTIIHQVVTGQIDVRTGKPYPAYKDSGVPWLDKVPEHWAVRRLSHACSIIVDGTHFSPSNTPDGEYLYITAKNIKEDGVVTHNATYVSAMDHSSIYARCPVQKGDVLYIKDGATAGIATVNDIEEEFSMLSSVALLRPSPETITPDYLALVMNDTGFKNHVLSVVVGGAMTRFTIALIKRFTVLLPPMSEQDEIVAYVRQTVTPLRTSIVSARREIDLLNEFRTKLIADVVTGKLDVRGYNVVEETDTTPRGG